MNNKNTSLKYVVDYNKKKLFIKSFQRLYVLPIKKAIRESNYSLQYHINEMNKLGFNYTYFGLTNTLRLNSDYCRNIDYFFYLYEYFGLPFPSWQYLQQCEDDEKNYKTLLKPIDSSMKKKRSNSPKKLK